MTQQCQTIAKKTNILVGCINRSTISEPHEEILSLQSVSIFGHWKIACIFGCVRGSPEEGNKNDSGLENVTCVERWRVVQTENQKTEGTHSSSLQLCNRLLKEEGNNVVIRINTCNYNTEVICQRKLGKMMIVRHLNGFLGKPQSLLSQNFGNLLDKQEE